MSRFLNSQFSQGTTKLLRAYTAKNASTAELMESLSGIAGRAAPTMIADYEAKQSLSAPLQKALLTELNLMIRGPSLYDADRFATAGIASDLRAAAEKHPTGEALLRLNRQLLDAAYPDTLVECGRSETWMYRLMGGSNTRAAGPKWLLSDSDVLDLQQFARQLLCRPPTSQKYTNPVSGYLVSRLSPQTDRMLHEFVARSEASADLPQCFTHDLNDIINNYRLYAPGRLAGIKLPPATLKIAAAAAPASPSLAPTGCCWKRPTPPTS